MLADGRTVQTKARWLERGTQRRFEFSDLCFDLAVLALFDRATFELIWARAVSIEELRRLAIPYRDTWRLAMALARNAGTDITSRLQRAYPH